MQLSVIIVNYNVKYFLEQCLNSVIKAGRNIDFEIFVVDNNSADGSCSMIKNKFSNVHLIENKENKGFSYANNQAIKKSIGKYILLLNPDTLVEEETFEKCINFMENHKDAGCLGVKMINGDGKYLLESKRSLPTPKVAFYKIFGLSKLFPTSKTFGKYHLGHIDNNKTTEIEIIAGAFMFIRKTALEKSGLLDESFFMYGEDIDLSYRIIKSGYINYYFPETTIIHYKGESTKKGSLNYVLLFYNAMIIFSKKHFAGNRSRLLSFFIHIAIFFKIFLAICSRIFNTLFLSIFDAGSIYLGFIIMSPIWEIYKFGKKGSYPKEYFYYEIPAYIIIWIISIFFSRGYEKPIKIVASLKGMLYGSIVIITAYSMLPEYLRFSRALLLIGTLWGVICSGSIRYLLHVLNTKSFKLKNNKKKNTLIIGNKDEFNQITKTLTYNNKNIHITGFVSSKERSHPHSIGTIDQLEEIIRINNVNLIIFGSTEMSSQQIIKTILLISEYQKIEYKIAGDEGVFLVGTNSIDTTNEFFAVNLNSIGNNQNIIRKRIFDITISLFLFILSPILLFLFKKPGKLFTNLIKILFGKFSFVGYALHPDHSTSNLPIIKQGILLPSPIYAKNKFDNKTAERINIQYAKDYHLKIDFQALLSQFGNLDK